MQNIHVYAVVIAVAIADDGASVLRISMCVFVCMRSSKTTPTTPITTILVVQFIVGKM